MIRKLILASIGIFFAGCASTMPPDLQAYLDEIRAAGMTEDARNALYGIAGIKIGSTIMRFRRGEETGFYETGYMSNMCPAPGVDPEEWNAIIREHDAKIEAEAAILRPIADTDRSGFVSSAEGWRFSEAMEFGARAAFIYEDLEHDRGGLLEALRLTEEQFQKRAEEYHYYLDLLPSYQKEPFRWLEWARLDNDDAAR